MASGEVAWDRLHAPRLTAGAGRILEVASDLFYRHGIHAVGVDTIAAESGITKRTLYDQFELKDGLITAYLQARHEAWWARLEARLLRARSPRVLAVFDAYADDAWPADRGCGFLNAAAELDADHPAYEVVRAHKLAVRRQLEDLVGADHPGLGDPDAVVDHLFLLLEGAIAHRGVDGDDRLLVSARAIAEQVVREAAAAATPVV